MMEIITSNLWAVWLGFSVSFFCGYGIEKWQWWVTVIPVAVLTFLQDMIGG